ncbi:uncharacterized protein KZ484_015670 [Pholidichthys leucotaenia]
MLDHNNVSLEVVLIPDQGTKKEFCQKTLYVAASFQKPKITVTGGKVTCRTEGGYPKPEVKWDITDHKGQQQELKQLEVRPVIQDGTYTVNSTADITNVSNVAKVRCMFRNPTSNKTVWNETTIPTEGLSPGIIIIVIIVGIIVLLVIIIIVVLRVKRNSRRGFSRSPNEQGEQIPLQ